VEPLADRKSLSRKGLIEPFVLVSRPIPTSRAAFIELDDHRVRQHSAYSTPSSDLPIQSRQSSTEYAMSPPACASRKWRWIDEVRR
jgi:hypothetical protein